MFSVSCVGFRFWCHGWIAQNSERKQRASHKPTDYLCPGWTAQNSEKKEGASHKPTDYFCVTGGLHKTVRESRAPTTSLLTISVSRVDCTKQRKQGASHKPAVISVSWVDCTKQ